MNKKVYDIFQAIMGISIIVFMAHWIIAMKSLIWFGEHHMYEPNIIIAIIEGGLASLSFAWFFVTFFNSCKSKLDEWYKAIALRSNSSEQSSSSQSEDLIAGKEQSADCPNLVISSNILMPSDITKLSLPADIKSNLNGGLEAGSNSTEARLN